MATRFSSAENDFLLQSAREAIQVGLKGETLSAIDLASVPPRLREPGACFVTLIHAGQLRGCVGSIEASRPLIKDVRQRALGAAFHDPRFPPLTRAEFEHLAIEISILTAPEPLSYQSPDDLVGKLRCGIDGVILHAGSRRATFLPQVWEKLPEPAQFLSRLCLKLGLASDAWQSQPLEVEVYQVVKIADPAPTQE
jgi:AmmeMemoRadiSam system protein A